MENVGANFLLFAIGGFVILMFFTIGFISSRYRRCPSDKILVVYGKVQKGRSSKTMHGGGAFIWPLFQDSQFLSLTPMTINIDLKNALSLQNIRINVPSTFTVGVSVDPAIMGNAAERLLGLHAQVIMEMAREIIFGQLRLTVASLTIEQINQDRESFLEAIRKNVEPELNKIGLYLINVNITDITDESDYIESIGKKAASEAINKAKVDVAEQQKLGAIGESHANREKDVRVAENVAQAEKGKKNAEADQRIFVQQKEAEAVVGEAQANRDKEVGVAQNLAETIKGKKKAEAEQRVYVQNQESEAVTGENISKANIAESNATLLVKQAEAARKARVAQQMAEAEIEKARYHAELQRLNAEEVAKKEIEKRKIEISAEAEAEKTRREAKGVADATLVKYQAEAEGIKKLLDSKATGYASLVESCAGDAKAAATLLMVEKLEGLVERQVKAIQNLKIDKITVWDSGGGDGKNSSTANFISGLLKAIPPMQDVASMAGVELPQFLGKLAEKKETHAADPRKGYSVPRTEPRPVPPKSDKPHPPASAPES
jgi:flotillin